ncbi:MAG TPA: helix-turn-helix transcriptional regulator [Alphaproteobacteria bacterium]|jgi:transcriptional regulator with XRE-family HTH domain|nr:helix-turn-helix transcriptional regulator [Alphaproteobacteria bacterium]
MTPFGARVRQLRRKQGVTLRAMAQDLRLSAAYLSALEHGRRSRPSTGLVQQICAYFGLIWDDAEELQRLARLSHPRVVVDTAGLSPAKTELANLLAERIRTLPENDVAEAIGILNPRTKRARN